MNLVVYNAGQAGLLNGPLGASLAGEHPGNARRQIPVEKIQSVSGDRVVANQSPTVSIATSARTTVVPDGKRNSALFDDDNPIPYSNKLGIRQYEDIQQEANGGGNSIFLSAVA
jgi:hypothetical protein